jgi:hypothetical protein
MARINTNIVTPFGGYCTTFGREVKGGAWAAPPWDTSNWTYLWLRIAQARVGGNEKSGSALGEPTRIEDGTVVHLERCNSFRLAMAGCSVKA